MRAQASLLLSTPNVSFSYLQNLGIVMWNYGSFSLTVFFSVVCGSLWWGLLFACFYKLFRLLVKVFCCSGFSFWNLGNWSGGGSALLQEGRREHVSIFPVAFGQCHLCKSSIFSELRTWLLLYSFTDSDREAAQIEAWWRIPCQRTGKYFIFTFLICAIRYGDLTFWAEGC